jgi:hypothetical protein
MKKETDQHIKHSDEETRSPGTSTYPTQIKEDLVARGDHLTIWAGPKHVHRTGRPKLEATMHCRSHGMNS